LKVYISQGSVATQITITAKCVCDRIFKVGQYFVKIWTTSMVYNAGSNYCCDMGNCCW